MVRCPVISGVELFLIRAPAANRPLLHHGDGVFLSGSVHDCADARVDSKFARLDFLNGSFGALRHHDFMRYNNSFCHGA